MFKLLSNKSCTWYKVFKADLSVKDSSFENWVFSPPEEWTVFMGMGTWLTSNPAIMFRNGDRVFVVEIAIDASIVEYEQLIFANKVRLIREVPMIELKSIGILLPP